MAYNYFFRYIPKDTIKTIFEIGCNNGNDTLIINNHFNPESYHAFEANPEKKNDLENKFKNYSNIKFNNKAVFDREETIDFYVCKSNSGASSILGKVKKEFCKIADAECGMSLENHQKRLDEYCTDIDWKKIEVETVILKNYLIKNNVNRIDLICMDVEGVGLSVLKGLGDDIKNVKYIISECDYGFTRENEETFEDINKYLCDKGFKIVENKFTVSILSDCLWVNNNI
tara:strand:+ start:1921 stop:2607 length:687 start_codon:yes stop_codon:yes gene_type:complete